MSGDTYRRRLDLVDSTGLHVDPRRCKCVYWTSTEPLAQGAHQRHNQGCPMRPETLLRDAAAAMRAWGAEGDGIPQEAWGVYQRLALATTGAMPLACDHCGGPLLEGTDPGLCAGCARSGP